MKSVEALKPFGDIDSLKWLKENLEHLSVTESNHESEQAQE
jgi:hypothetical protein